MEAEGSEKSTNCSQLHKKIKKEWVTSRLQIVDNWKWIINVWIYIFWVISWLQIVTNTWQIVTCCRKYLPNNYRIITEKWKILPNIMLFVKSRNKKYSNYRTINCKTMKWISAKSLNENLQKHEMKKTLHFIYLQIQSLIK